MARGNAIQARGTRNWTADGTICALAEANETSVAFTDIADAVRLVIVVLAHFVGVIDIAATGPGGATGETASRTGAADGAALFQRLALEITGGMRWGDLGCLVAGAGCGDALQAGES